MNCPQCATKISKENINIATDLGQCGSCEHIFRISENIQTNIVNDNFNMNKPPKGAWVNKRKDRVVIGVSTGSWDLFFGYLLGVMVAGGCVGGVYGSQIIRAEFNLPLSLFGIFFVIFFLILWGQTLIAIWGKIVLTIDKRGGKIFTGVGMIGKTKVFSWAEVAVIKENEVSINDHKTTEIWLEGSTRVSFGSDLSTEKRYYLFRALNDIMAKVKANKNIG
jgi:hypothetical protein